MLSRKTIKRFTKSIEHHQKKLACQEVTVDLKKHLPLIVRQYTIDECEELYQTHLEGTVKTWELVSTVTQ